MVACDLGRGLHAMEPQRGELGVGEMKSSRARLVSAATCCSTRQRGERGARERCQIGILPVKG